MRTRPLRLAAAATIAVVVAWPSADAHAQTRELRWDPAWDLSVTGVAVAGYVTTVALQSQLAPSSCHWCDVDGVDTSVRDALVWSSTSTADTLSNVLGFALVPVAAVGLDALAAAHEGSLGSVPVDALIIGEATFIAMDVTQITKYLVGRERPFVHALPPDQKPLTAHPSDNNLSFFSGHTTETFALATAAGTVATLRGYRWAPLVWAVGGALAAMTGYLRIAADKHWFTDVLTGMAVGGGIGFAVPYLFHRPSGDSSAASATTGLKLAPMPGGAALSFVW